MVFKAGHKKSKSDNENKEGATSEVSASVSTDAKKSIAVEVAASTTTATTTAATTEGASTAAVTATAPPVKLTKGQAIMAGKARAAAAKLERERQIAAGLIEPDADESIGGSKRKRNDINDMNILQRSKRQKILIPDDRKAFFAVASLLIDSSKVPTGKKLTTENFENYIPSDKMHVLKRLKEHLLYDC